MADNQPVCVPCGSCGTPVQIAPGPAYGLLVNYGARTLCRRCAFVEIVKENPDKKGGE